MKAILILISLLPGTIRLFGQCHNYRVLTRSISNKPTFHFASAPGRIARLENKITLEIDTIDPKGFANADDQGYDHRNKYAHCIRYNWKDSQSFEQEHFLLERNTGLLTRFAVGELTYNSPLFLSNALAFFRMGGNYGLSLIDYRTKTISTFPLSHGFRFIGNNDTAVFIQADSKKNKAGGKRYHKNQILAVSHNGIHKINEEPSERIKVGEFFNTNYMVREHVIGTIHRECSTEDIYMTNVFFNHHVIDSMETEGGFLSSPIQELFLDNTLHLYTAEFYRIYRNGQLAGYWNMSHWKDSLPLLKYGRWKSIRTSGDTLFLVKSIDTAFHLCFSSDTRMTVNGIPLQSAASEFDVILAFDLVSGNFLGYPMVTFTGIPQKKEEE